MPESLVRKNKSSATRGGKEFPFCPAGIFIPYHYQPKFSGKAGKSYPTRHEINKTCSWNRRRSSFISLCGSLQTDLLPLLLCNLSTRNHHSCSYALFKPAISILTICSIACMTRPDFAASLSCSSLPKMVGTICQESPNLSFSQPHCSG